MTHTPRPTGLQLIRAEQARQFDDAQLTCSDPAQRRLAADIAAQLRQPGATLLLLGMGGSHHANQAAAGAYRHLGVPATAMTLDEALVQPLPADPARVTVIASQSGDSGEIAQYLGQSPGQAQGRSFGLSLNPDGHLARHLPTLLAAGGGEQGFAATRSFLLSLTLHQLVLEALGAPRLTFPLTPLVPDTDARPLEKVTSVIFLGSGGASGVAAMGALGVIELARIPALAYELGQFRHGPPELLTPHVGVIVLRSPGGTPYLTQTLARVQDVCEAAGSPHLTLSAAAADAGSLAAWIQLCPAVQNLVVDLAAQRVADVGQPVRSGKVTR
ncbi:phosphosugar isomerase (plasmid) [Deinococcus taeanensis]|uniref:SIS domain-containing protein n=1 Tax=Deinococcus taeanensis TaxID=2737050 RepID=UPI001CDBE80A|nr:phosphosugar isomerase [Deinococcus taeanensis]UBV44597.1 phosphosugar isomerase [Deinococcus taeanensis]